MSEAAAGARDEGLRLLQAGDIDGARRSLEQAISADPTDGRAHGLLGICQARKGDMAAAVQSMQEAARLLPTDAPSQFNLANALLQTGRAAEARTAVERALALSPNYDAARQLLTRIDASGVPVAPPPVATAPPPISPFGAPPPSAAPPASPPSPFGAPPPAFGAPPPPAPGMGAAPGIGAPLGGAPLGSPAFGAPPPPGIGAAPTEQWTPAPPPAGMSVPGMHAPSVEGVSAAGFVGAAHGVVNTPELGTRISRALLWGAVYGQIWTIWGVISLFIGTANAHDASGYFVNQVVGRIIIHAFAGLVAAVLIALLDADEPKGGVIGIVAGMIACAARIFYFQNFGPIFGVVFYFVLGRYVGSLLAARIQQPTPR